MSRLETMSRFEEPKEMKPVAHCSYCDGELYEGDSVLEYDGFKYCTEDCLCEDWGVKFIDL